jgi:hypothetical protein
MRPALFAAFIAIIFGGLLVCAGILTTNSDLSVQSAVIGNYNPCTTETSISSSLGQSETITGVAMIVTGITIILAVVFNIFGAECEPEIKPLKKITDDPLIRYTIYAIVITIIVLFTMQFLFGGAAACG